LKGLIVHMGHAISLGLSLTGFGQKKRVKMFKGEEFREGGKPFVLQDCRFGPFGKPSQAARESGEEYHSWGGVRGTN